MTEVKCSDCGKQTTVPFEPTAGRPVYCKECFEKKRATGGPRGGGGRGGPRGGFRGERPKTTFKRSEYPGYEDIQ